MNKFKKRAVSALVSAVSLFSVPALIVSVMPTVRAEPKCCVDNHWTVWGSKDLAWEKALVWTRITSPDRNSVIAMIDKCICEGKVLHIKDNGWNNFSYWI